MKKRIPYWPYAAGILCFIYVVLRAILIPLTFDEIWTISTVATRSLGDILAYSDLGSNSHLLNSWFVRIIHNIVPGISYSEHALYRIPNVLAFLLYAWFTIRMIRSIPNSWMQIMAFILCFCDPFLLEFFSLARGYGLAMAFTAASMYYLDQNRLQSTSTSTSTSTLTLTFASLAVLSNFVWLNFYLAVLSVLVYIQWIKYKNFSWQFWLRLGIPTLLLFAIIIKPIIKLRQGNELWYGGKTGLVYDTFTSLIQGIMGFRIPDFPAHVVLASMALLLIVLFLVHVRYGISVSKALLSGSTIYLIIFVLISASSLLQNLLFHTPFLVNRTALVYLLPLVWMILSACASAMEKKPWQLASVGTLLLSLAAFINFIQVANFTHTYSWPFDAKSELVMEYLNKQGEERKDTIHVDNSWITNASMQYVNNGGNYPWVRLIRGEPDSVRMAKIDYYYLYDRDRPYAGYSAYNALPDSFFRDTALYFPEQDLLLLKVRK